MEKKCIVQARIGPEHKVKDKPYNVTASIDDTVFGDKSFSSLLAAVSHLFFFEAFAGTVIKIFCGLFLEVFTQPGTKHHLLKLIFYLNKSKKPKKCGETKATVLKARLNHMKSRGITRSGREYQIADVTRC